MKRDTINIAVATPPPSPGRRLASAWNAFWFTPADPTVLGLMRICCGLITLYTTAMYSFALMDFMGPYAWYDLQLRHEQLQLRPILADPLSGRYYRSVPPKDEFEKDYANDYFRKFGDWPPPPYPRDRREAEYIEQFRFKYPFDLRQLGLPPPETAKQRKDLEDYVQRWRVPMPAYPQSEEEVADINAFIERHGADPRRAYSMGTPVWSIWFHVTDPAAMGIIHGLFLLATLMFTLGLCTRLSTFVTWFAALSYIHRAPTVLFGVDTMMNILLIYFMIGPAGAALSLDRLIARWWSKARGRFLGSEGRFDPRPQPSVSANLALRLVQVHLCIIYGMAGFAKLLGAAWWNGTAIWGTLANFEFAPMQYEVYNALLRMLASNQLIFETFLTTGSFFTLAFEIGYPFLIWRPRARWLYLGAAILLHGFIGLLMGLKTFSLMMLVMNMAFLSPREAHWMVQLLFDDSPPPPKP
jgi:hypothetical protein